MVELRAERRYDENTSTAGAGVDWRSSAACSDAAPELFFPVGRQGRRRLAGDGPDPAEPAKSVCRRCPVVRDCLKEAIANDVQGVWGGTTYEERDQLREQYGITARPVRVTVAGDDPQRDVVRLSGGGGYSPPDIANVLRLPLNTVHQYLSRARRDGLIEKELPHDRIA